MIKKSYNAANAPEAVGPYVHAVEASGLVFTSGQLGLDPETGNLKEGIEGQTVQALKNIGEVLKASGCKTEDVIKTTIFMTEIKDFGKVNEIYARFFKDNPPARSCVGVKELPKGASIEIETVALKIK